MSKPINASEYVRKPYVHYVVLTIIYLALSYFTSPTAEVTGRYHLTIAAYRFIVLSVAFPLAAIWYTAFYGYEKLLRYAKTIRNNQEGKAVNRLSTGLMFLAYGLPITSIVSNLMLGWGNHHPSSADMAIVLSHYVGLLFPLIAFTYIGIGANRLASMAKRKSSVLATHIFALTFIGLSVAYCAIVIAIGNPHEAFRLPLWATLASVVIPYLYAWYLGLVAAYHLFLYNQSVRGLIYRRSWGLLSLGIGSIVIVSIILQYISSLTTQLNRLGIFGLLALIYFLLILISFGYILVAWGAKQLQHIEEV